MRRRKVSFKISPTIIGPTWPFLGMMYMFTSDTVQPIDKMEFFWRTLAGIFNFLPI